MVLQDECSRYKVHTRLANGPASEKDVLIYLREAFEKHGAPLVLKQDNAAYQNTEAVQKLCEEYGVLILNSPPGYPPYNGKIERGMRDIKGYVRGLKRRNKGENLQQQIGLAIKDLNEDRPRPVLKGKTAKEVFEQRSIRLPSRKQFRIRVQTRQIELEEKARDRRELHAARRRAVQEVLLHYDLLKWKGDASTYLNAKRVTN
jgi:transposase InsO family protein